MKGRYELIVPCHFGLEAVLKKEITDLGYDIVQVEDGRVTFLGDEEAVCRANVFLRTGERVLLKAGSLLVSPPCQQIPEGRDSLRYIF